jgi:signal transduction histidine kinase
MPAMTSLSNASNSATAAPRRGLAVAAGVLVSLLVLGMAGLVIQDDSGLRLMIGATLCMAMLLLAVAAIGWHVGVRLTRQRLGELLRESRMQTQALVQLQHDWHWASDADHHLVRWQAPQGAVASAWAGVAATQTLLERFQCAADSAVRAALDARRNFDGLPVRDEAGHQWLLRGIACFDAQGRFAGYQGAAEPLRPEASTSSDASEQVAFAYTISHDLRAPLRVIEGFGKILREDYGPQLDRVGNDHVDRIMGAASRMHGMIDALLSLSQLSVRPLARQAVDLSQMAGSILEDLCRGEPGRAVSLHVAPELIVEGDPALLRIALENLLGNAWKYSANCECAQIRFEMRQEPGRRVFVVSDQGAGFDMRFADRLFGAFQRLHSASEFPGTGVGLASVRRIVRRHGGEVWAEGAVGLGARFYFTLA